MTKLQLEELTKRALWTCFQAFVASFALLLPGILAAPNLKAAQALGTSALIASLGAGLSALKGLILTYRR